MNNTKNRFFVVRIAALAIAGVLLGSPAFAQTNLGKLTFANAIEQGAATSNDAVYGKLNPLCNPGSALDQTPSPTYAQAQRAGAAAQCTSDVFFVYTVTRELVHTANELVGSGPTASSLNVDLDGLGKALRWTAAEELAAQGSMATQFANNQLSTLAARLNALRFGATGFASGAASAGLYNWQGRNSPLMAQNGDQPASTSVSGESYSPWGGFLNYGFGYGKKSPTALEDAFDFDGSEITIGADYRLRNGLVLGGILGDTRQTIDFDPAASDISVVDGGVKATGMSFIVFAMWQGEHLTIDGSVGEQKLDYNIERDIKYPSFNPDVTSVYSIAFSHPNADVFTTTFNVSWAFNRHKLTIEPFVGAENYHVTVDPFSEQRSINQLSSTETRSFDLSVSEQTFSSLQTSVGVRLQYVVTPRFGVVVPYGALTARNELDDNPRTITSGYAQLAGVLGTPTFALPTDAPDRSYYTATVGCSIVLRGARQRKAGGPVAGGASGFVQFATIGDRTNYEDHVFTAGFRYEF